jgi:hypothetical protein
MFRLLPRSAIKVRFPLWQYLSQPLFCSTAKLILNPDRFWQDYQIQILEHSWNQESIQFLERCWQQPCNIPQSPK